MADPSPAKPPIPSATVLLLRDGRHGLEVFMVKRHREIDFASDALVFPGGKVHDGDSEPGLLARAATGLDPAQIPLRIAAIREAFEESAILLCRPRGQAGLVDGARVGALGPRYRTALDQREISFTAFAEAEQIDPACDVMVPFARWITPLPMPKRFDTWFYLARAPEDQLAAHDGREAVDSMWAEPNRLVEEADAGRATLVFATRMQLVKLGRSRNVDEAMAAAQAAPLITVLPEFGSGPDGPTLKIPLDAGYGITEMAIKGMKQP